MSVVVIREGILYTDSIGIVAPCNYKKRIEKQIADPMGDLVYAFCGDLPRKKDLPNLMRQAREWFQNWYFGADQEGVPDLEAVKKFLPDSWFIVAWNDGFIGYKYGRLSVHEIDDLIDGGDGGTYTMAALDCGLSGKKLEEFVNSCNPNSGIGMQITNLLELKDPENETGIEVGTVKPIYAEAPDVNSEQSVIAIANGLVSFSNQLPTPWRNTQRADFNFDDCYTEYGFFVPYGYGSRLFFEFANTGYFDPQTPGQGASCGMLISSDGMLYDVSYFGVALAGFSQSETKPGQWDVRPLVKFDADLVTTKGGGWTREYVYACLKLGKHNDQALHMVNQRFSCPSPRSYRHYKVTEIIKELKARNIKPVVKTKIRPSLDLKMFAKHYKEVERLFPAEMIEKYKL